MTPASSYTGVATPGYLHFQHESLVPNDINTWKFYYSGRCTFYFLVRAAHKNGIYAHVSEIGELHSKLLIERGFLIELNTASARNWVEYDIWISLWVQIYDFLIFILDSYDQHVSPCRQHVFFFSMTSIGNRWNLVSKLFVTRKCRLQAMLKRHRTLQIIAPTRFPKERGLSLNQRHPILCMKLRQTSRLADLC
jgi:hypothetical protein